MREIPDDGEYPDDSEVELVREWGLYRPPEEFRARSEYHLEENRLLLKGNFEHLVELRLGWDERTPPIYLIPGKRCPQLGADYLVVQPSVVRENPSRGWLPVGGRFGSDVQLGRDWSPELELGQDVDYMAAAVVCKTDGTIEIASHARGFRVVADPTDLAEDFEAFNRDRLED